MAGRAYRWATPAALAAAGLMFVTSAENAAGTDLRGGRYSDAADLVRGASTRADRLADEVAALQAEVDSLRGSSGGDPAVERRRLAALEAQAGLAPLSGPGLTVSLDDATVPDQLPDGSTVDDYLVHQQDVEGVLNALWRGGAKGITVMGQRLITTSAVRCVGPVLLLQGRTYYPPYVVTAVGTTSALRAALDASPQVRTYREYADALGLGYAVTEHATTDLPGYAGAVRVTRARPVPG